MFPAAIILFVSLYLCARVLWIIMTHRTVSLDSYSNSTVLSKRTQSAYYGAAAFPFVMPERKSLLFQFGKIEAPFY